MSIRQEIIAHARERRILRLLPALPNRPVIRTMLISEEIRAWTHRSQSMTAMARQTPARKLRAVLS